MKQTERSDAISASTPRPSAYQQVKNAILDGSLPPGSALVEGQVAEWCDVSRTPVREAFTRLEGEGLIERGQRGLVVRERSPEQILDIYEVRIVLEGMAARVAAERRTSLDLMRIEKTIRAAEAADATDSSEMVRRNADFHQSIWRATHNDALIDLLTRLNLHLGRYPATTLAHPGRWEEALREHRGIVEAISRGELPEATRLSSEHFIRARDIRLSLWEVDTY